MRDSKEAKTLLRGDPFNSDERNDIMLRSSRHAMLSAFSGVATGGGADQSGRFSYLFPELAADPFSTLPTDANGDMLPSILTGLEALADSMNAPSGDSTIRGGMTYLGQFTDHDITFDPISSLARLNDPSTIRNFRTPGLNLDNLYGSGPGISPFQYDGGQ